MPTVSIILAVYSVKRTEDKSYTLARRKVTRLFESSWAMTYATISKAPWVDNANLPSHPKKKIAASLSMLIN